jgi:acetolactate decarboxylase
MSRDFIDERLLGALHLSALTKHGFEHDPLAEHVAFQVGTLDSLMKGRFDGDISIGEVLKHGNLGIGTIQHLGGELIIVDGEAFVGRADGSLDSVAHQTKTPFAVVCQFAPTAIMEVENIGFLDLCAAMNHEVIANSPMLAFRIDGLFHDVVLRSVPEQSPPYPLLSTVVDYQTSWTLDGVEGTVVGFRFPDQSAGVEVPGFHMHFIAADRSTGGHVASLTLRKGSVSLDGGSELHVELPKGVNLGTPGVADRAAIRHIEGG